MSLLAGYRLHHGGRSLADYLDEAVFKTVKKYTLTPVSEDVEGFDRFMQIYENGLDVERAAVKVL
jgi:hypothetical protein